MKKNLFFIGAGGIGMAALERYFLAKGYNVAGYDLTETPLTDQLSREGVEINYTGSVEAVPIAFRDPSTTLVVYTPAVPSTLPCFEWFRDNGFEIIKRAALLGYVTRDSYSLCFAGTHGKTSTSSLAAHILTLTPKAGCNAFVGGILRNHNSNFLLCQDSDISVIEADEFDRSFHKLEPSVAVVTSTDPDHLDIYGNETEYLEAFSVFTSLVKENGFLVKHTNLQFTERVKPSVKVYTYTGDVTEEADFRPLKVERKGNHYLFDLRFPDGSIVRDLELGVPVRINVDNSIAAIAAVYLSGNFNETSVREALLSYKGVERRFEVRWEEKKSPYRVIIDDYAHHPSEIETSIRTVKEMFPGREITVAFQPHLYTRTRDFAPQFARALDNAHKVILVSLYPAREVPIPGISSHTILDLVSNHQKQFIDKENFPFLIKNCNFDVLLTLGAGDLPNYIAETVKLLEKESS